MPVDQSSPEQRPDGRRSDLHEVDDRPAWV